MANYEEQARSNYFKVKNVDKFKEFLEEHYLHFIEDKKGLVGFLAHDGIPSWNQETDEEMDFMNLLSKHLADNEVAIIVGNGYEKMRYLSGFAVAVNKKGKTASVNISDIYNKAKRLTKNPENITLAEY